MNIAPVSNVPISKKNLCRRESVANFNLNSKDEFIKDTIDVKLTKLNAQTGRRRSCIENYEIRSPVKELMNKHIIDKQQNVKQLTINDRPQDDVNESELSFSMQANVSNSKLESSNSSLSTTNSIEETKFLNRQLNKDDRLSTNLKQKMKRINFKQQQSLDNVQQQENSNCLLM